MITLTIDIGNSRTKIALFDDEDYISGGVYDHYSLENVKKVIKGYDIAASIICSVKKNVDYEVEELKKLCGGGEVVIFDHKEIEKYSPIIEYKGEIGPDRVAAFLGTKFFFENIPLLIVDAGTAITLDVCDRNENFIGGNISLGITGRFKALAESTSLLPRIDELIDNVKFGYDTETAIEAGILNGVIGEVDYTARMARLEYGITWIVTTGGDGELIAKKVNLLFDNVVFIDYLVGFGLDYHLRKYILKKPLRKNLRIAAG